MLNKEKIITLLKWNIVRYIKELEQKSISAIEYEAAIKTYLTVLKMKHLIDGHVFIGTNEAERLLKDIEKL